MLERSEATRHALPALCLAACLLLGLSGPPAVHAGPAAASTEAASATLPLEEILKLYRQRDEAARKVESPPPVAAALQKLELQGRLLDRGIEFRGHFEVSVLSDGSWVTVPLLVHDERLQLSQLPVVTNGAFAVQEGELVFLTKKRGRYAFDLSLFREAQAEGRVRRLSLAHGGAALAACRLEIDAGLFRLRGPQLSEDSEGVQVYARGDAFDIEWEVLEQLEPRSAEAGVRLAVESVVPRVHASTVSTLEGRRITRVLYELRFAGRKPIAIDLPEGQSLERVFLNGVAIPAEPEAGRLDLELEPARAGDEGGTLELVLANPGGVFHLAGDLHFELPRVSWPTHELFFTLHLPRVFDYEWRGGSLEPSATCPKARYSYGLPLPGKPLHFHQFLVSGSAPDVALDYAVNLDGHYFAVGRTGQP